MSECIERADLAAAIRDGKAAILDVRSDGLFRLAHVPGAASAPADRIGASGGLPGVDPKASCIVYGAGSDGAEDGECDRALAALAALGFSDVRHYAKGFRDWVAARMPCDPPALNYACTVCSYGYFPHVGDPKHGIPPGTLFETLPNTWRCPWCGAKKDRFEAER